MAQRITRESVDFYLKRLNAALKERNSKVQYDVVGRNGALSIDYYNDDKCVDALHAGLSTREAYNVILAMFHVVSDGFPQ